MRKPILIALPNIVEFGHSINAHLNDLYQTTNQNYIADVEYIRFSNGEGKCVINENISGKDVFILCDPSNYGVHYDLINTKHFMGPDEHIQDIKRTISALQGQANRINIVMPLLYQSRQDKRKKLESLDCAIMLKELEWYGVKNIITVDIHNIAVENAIPFKTTLYNVTVLDELLKEFSLVVDTSKLFVVSPDSGASKKADFAANYFGGIENGSFEKRRNYNVVKNGQNPIEFHEFNGPKTLEGRDILVVDDMIATGSSLLSSIKALKKIQANKIHLMTTFSLFTNGIECFVDAHKKGLFDALFTTNLSYIPPAYKNHSFIHIVDCSEKIANLIYNINKES